MSSWGIDIGGTKVAVRVETDTSEPYEDAMTWSGSGDVREDLAVLRAAVASARDAAGAPHRVGIAFPAALDAAGRVTSWPNRPHWTGLDWGAVLDELFPGVAARTADDGDLAALAEAERAGSPDVLYFGVGTGVGGGVVLGGRPVPGPERGSCELGHAIADPAGPRCVCGRRGCLQAVASGPAVLRAAGRLRGADTDFDELRRAWLDGQEWAAVAVESGCAALASVAVSTAELLHPELVLIGGGFAAGLPGFADVVARHVTGLARPGHRVPRVRQARLGGLSSLHGAVLLGRQD
ncbi:ROK family protein [Saccharopolyspora hordei]|uniref:Kanosamine 6-kinase n=1 Tax=Saccharopolyspora hordei TaxID=1838 RepID=A0A853APC4_9PSEU|nr:ROK family protein [Saccharopolyspora hordei]NYI84313.1 kanosamine 6-kinase [Saccharopolyspora hordei]